MTLLPYQFVPLQADGPNDPILVFPALPVEPLTCDLPVIITSDE
jgi:hypothetical protein